MGAPVTYPKAEDHVNSEIKDFLEYFSSSRKITTAPPSNTAAFKRSDDDKSKILEEFSAATTAESSQFSQISEEREQMKERRQGEREEAFKDVEEEREKLKESFQTIIYEDRAKYRSTIEDRKDKEAAVAEKNKDLLQALLERFDQESAALSTPIPIDAKVLNDAKGNLAKMK